MVLTTVFVATVGLYTATAAMVDLCEHRIPNYLTVPAAVLGLMYHGLFPGGWGLLSALAGMAIGFSLLLLPWLLGGGGMGDVKLLAALGAWLGPILMLVAFAASIFVAALAAVGVLVYSTCHRGVSVTKKKYLARRRSSRKGRPVPVRVVPFAVPVAVSTWLVMAWLVLRGNLI